MFQVPMVSPAGPACGFCFAKHSPDVLNRVLTEVAGAPFIKSAAAAAERKAKRAAADQNTGASSLPTAVDVSDLLQPKKKARRNAPKGRAAKAKAKASASASGAGGDVEMSVQDMEGDVSIAMPATGEDDDEGNGSSRPRWWIDDVLSCLAYAAGGSLARAHE